MEIRKIVVAAQPGQKFTKIHLNQKSWVQWHMPVIPAMQEV
jgi:hypothetical protein